MPNESEKPIALMKDLRKKLLHWKRKYY